MNRSPLTRQPSLADLTEKEWQQQVVQLAKQLGWRRPYHTHDSRRSEPGFPDLTLVRDRVVFLELKRETGKLTDPQKDWIRALHTAGAEAYVARPRDLQQLAQILLTTHGHQRPEAAALREQTRQEVAA